MSVWREVQERLYGRWESGWADTTRFALSGETFEPDKDETWARVRVQSRPGTQETLGAPGNRKMSRRGVVFALLRQPAGKGEGPLSDLAEKAKGLFEGQRFAPHGIRFGECDVGAGGEIEGGRWWGVTVECPFDYEEII